MTSDSLRSKYIVYVILYLTLYFSVAWFVPTGPLSHLFVLNTYGVFRYLFYPMRVNDDYRVSFSWRIYAIGALIVFFTMSGFLPHIDFSGIQMLEKNPTNSINLLVLFTLGISTLLARYTARFCLKVVEI